MILDNPAVWSDSFLTPWESRYWPDSDSAGLYRPLTTFSFWLDAKFWGPVPRGFLVTNLLLHTLVSMALLSCLRAIFPRRPGLTLFASLLFAVHPLHSEAVVGIVGRAELLAAFGSLAAWRTGLVFLDGGRRSPLFGLLSALALLLGLFGKESATGLILLLGVHLLQPEAPRRRVLTLGALWAAAIAVALLARIRVLGSLFALGPVSRMDNVLAHVDGPDRVATALFVQARVVWQLIWPAELSPDYSYPQIVPGTTEAWTGALFAIAATLLVLFSLLRRDRELLVGWALTLAAGILTSNLLFPIGTVYGERLAYLPSAGLLWILVVLVSRLLTRLGADSWGGSVLPRSRALPSGSSILPGSPVLLILLAATLVSFGTRSALRAPEWRSNVSLFESASRAAPRSAKVWTNLGLARLEAGDIAGGLAAATRALELDPDYPAAVHAKGSALIQAGRPAEAIPLLERNTGLAGKRGLDALLELGNAEIAREDGLAALSYFERARSRSTDRDERWVVGLASSYALQSNWPESRQYWQNAVALKPGDAAFRQRYGYVLWQDGALDEAEAIYRILAAETPDDPEALNELAWFLAVTERAPEDALTLAERAFGLSPNSNVADTWLEAWLRARGCEAARSWLEEAGVRFSGEIRRELETKWSERCDQEPRD